MDADAALTAEAVAAVDSTAQAAEILDLPTHLRDALWRVDSAALRTAAPSGPGGGLMVAGMGGSGIGGRLASAALGVRATRPLTTVAGYSLPPWATADTTVLCASYSGTTEETLGCYDAAGSLGARRIVATTGGPLADRARRDGVPVIPLPAGFQPRAAVGYAMVVVLEVAAVCGVGPSLRTEVEAAATLAEELASAWGPRATEDSEAKALARRLHGTVPIVVGAELTEPVAYPLEVPAQRERQAARLLLRAPRARSQRDRRLAGVRRARPLRRRLPRRRRDPPADAGPDRAHRGAHPVRRRGDRDGPLARHHPHRARRLARPARRPPLPLPRGAAGGRSDRGSTSCRSSRRGSPRSDDRLEAVVRLVDQDGGVPTVPLVSGLLAAAALATGVLLGAQVGAAALLLCLPGAGVAAGLAARHQRRERRLVELSRRDPLTGLGNARLLADRLPYEIARHARHGRPLAVLVCDLDGFKRVNDRFGHAAGDEVLREVGAALARTARGQDTVARQGGDEFSVLMPESGREAAERLAERLRAAARGAMDGVDASWGVAVFPTDGATAGQLLEVADAAARETKRRRSSARPRSAVRAA
jgi:diguanylate cyclase (GGDEF)-like protein